MLQRQGMELLWKQQASGDDWQATVQLDAVNQRVKLKSYQFEGRQGLAALGEYLISLAREQGFGKVLAEVREADWEQFVGRGFAPEGIIPGYFEGEVAYCVSYFTNPDRQASSRLAKENAILEQVLSVEPVWTPVIDSRFTLEPCTADDAPELAQLFRKVFTTYPTPLHDPAYVRDLIRREEAIFRLVRDGRRLVSAAAAEIDWQKRNAEMTNCATLPDYRGEGLMAAILADLEPAVQEREIGCLFSLARASSHGMNLVLRRLGYRFRGRLINNCHIMGDFEDMNIWVKL